MFGERSTTLLPPSLNGTKPESRSFSTESHQILVNVIDDVSDGANFLTASQKFEIRQKISVIPLIGSLAFLRSMKPYFDSFDESTRNALGREIYREVVSTEGHLSPGGAEMLKVVADYWMMDTFGIDRLERWGKETNGAFR